MTFQHYFFVQTVSFWIPLWVSSFQILFSHALRVSFTGMWPLHSYRALLLSLSWNSSYFWTRGPVFSFCIGPRNYITGPACSIQALFKLFEFYSSSIQALLYWSSIQALLLPLVLGRLGPLGVLRCGTLCVLSHHSLSPFSALTPLVLNHRGEWGAQQSPHMIVCIKVMVPSLVRINLNCPCLLDVAEGGGVEVAPLDSVEETGSVPSVPEAHCSSGSLGPCLALLRSTLMLTLWVTCAV